MPDTECLRAVLTAYGVRPRQVSEAGGTAGRTWRVATEDAEYFVRRRGVRTSAPARIAFDHALRKHLAGRGSYVTPPLPARDGASYVRSEGGIYELYPWVDGLPFQPARAAASRADAARVLAWFHREAGSLDATCEPLLPQFGHYPAPIEPRRFFDHPQALLEAARFVATAYDTPADRDTLRRAVDRVQWLGDTYGALIDALPHAVIHGDYNHCNMLYDEDGRILGLFDFDWSRPDVRIRDVGDGMLFFGARRDDMPDGGDIWSLTACPVLDTAAMLEFVAAYHSASPLTPEEQRAVPLAMLGRWVAMRLEGVMKVPEHRRAEFFLWSLDIPFEWYGRDASAFGRLPPG